MKRSFTRTLAIVCMLALVLAMLPAASAAETGEFTILSTTDMHGRCWDTNVLTGSSESATMLAVATAAAKVRAEKENVLLIDNGDIYQGTQVSGYQLAQQAAGATTDPNPMALSLAEIGYDYAMLGNHEFNYSWKVMSDVRSYLETNGVQTLCANLYYDGTDGVHARGENVFTPYAFKTFTVNGKEFKVAVIGFENTDCPRWDVPDNYPGIVFTHPDNPTGAMAWEAERYIAKVREEGADAVIVAYHSGLGDPTDPADIEFGVNSENQIASMVANNTGIDLVIAGHDHAVYPTDTVCKNKNGKEVPVVNGGGQDLTCTTFAVDADGKVSVKSNENLALSKYAADAALKEKIKPYAAAAETYVNQPVGHLTGTWNTVSNYYLAQSDAMDLINRAQMAQGGVHLAEKYDTAEKVAALKEKTGLDHLTVDLSATSVVISGGYRPAAGAVSMKDIYRLYRYDNSLYLVPLTGAQIKEIMEFNASERLSVSTMSGKPIFGTKNDDFTNPIFYGLDFVYDMSRDPGDRVQIKQFSDGREFDLNKTYLMAINNYHLGNGPFKDYSPADSVWSQNDDMSGATVQTLIAEYLAASEPDGIAPAPSKWSVEYLGEIKPGVATGKYIADLAAKPADLKNGDTVLIYHVAGNQLIVTNGADMGPKGTPNVTTGDKQIGTDVEKALFTLEIDAAGKYLFRDAEGNYLTATNGLVMKAPANEYSTWDLEPVGTDGIVHVHSVNAAYNGNKNQYLEFYGGKFTTYGLGSGGGAYEYMIFVLKDTCTHEHTKTETKEATCTEGGYERVYCLDCGADLMGAEFPALGHDYQETVVAPTCTAKGYTEYTCSRCGDSYKKKFTAMVDHKYENGKCAVCGAADPSYKPEEDTTPKYGDFSDLKTGRWYEAGVTFALKNGLMNGVGGGKFDPDGSVTRGMLVTILYRVEKTPSVEGMKNPFTDVKSGAWYADAIVWAADQGIVNGTSATTFAPDAFITREQIATILYRYAKAEKTEKDLSAYPDAGTVSGYAVDAMRWAVAEGLINGKDGRLAPQENATRAQIATILERYLSK